jgi:hypothetical protein
MYQKSKNGNYVELFDYARNRKMSKMISVINHELLCMTGKKLLGINKANTVVTKMTMILSEVASIAQLALMEKGYS